MYNHSDDGLPVAVSTGYQNLTFLETGTVNGVDFVTIGGNSSLKIARDGIYKVDYIISFAGQATREYQFTLLKDDVEQNKCDMHRKMGTSSDVGSGAGTCLLSLSSGDSIYVAVKDLTGTSTVNYEIFSMNVMRIGN